MSGLSVVARPESVNGRAKRPARKPPGASKPQGSRKALKHARCVACGVGAVGVGVLSLSVAHCTESIGMLTGSHWALSGLLAVGIDAGMVASELAELGPPIPPQAGKAGNGLPRIGTAAGAPPGPGPGVQQRGARRRRRRRGAGKGAQSRWLASGVSAGEPAGAGLREPGDLPGHPSPTPWLFQPLPGKVAGV